MRLDLELTPGRTDLVDCRLLLCELALDLSERLAGLCELTLDRPDRLDLYKDAARPRRCAARERPTRVIDVALERDRLGQDGLVKRHALGRVLVCADEGAAKDKGHRGRDLGLVADERDGRLHPARRELLRRVDLLQVGGKVCGVNLICAYNASRWVTS